MPWERLKKWQKRQKKKEIEINPIFETGENEYLQIFNLMLTHGKVLAWIPKQLIYDHLHTKDASSNGTVSWEQIRLTAYPGKRLRGFLSILSLCSGAHSILSPWDLPCVSVSKFPSS